MKFRERMAEKLKLPKDLVMGAAVLTVTGRSEAYVENYRGIIEYTDQRIRLQTKTCQMTLCGECLHIDYYTEDEMKISGQIGKSAIVDKHSEIHQGLCSDPARRLRAGAFLKSVQPSSHYPVGDEIGRDRI